MIDIKTSEKVQAKLKGIRFGILQCNDIRVEKNSPEFEKELDDLTGFLKDKFSNQRPAEDPVVKAVRRMYGSIGWEPTRYRPSSEALVRRIIQDKGLYRINDLVDYGNLVSARFHLPMGLYDFDKIEGQIQFDVGREGESYAGISKPKIGAEGKFILRDEAGIFGNPTADSLRTSIQPETNNILAIFFCPANVKKDHLQKTLKKLERYYSAYTLTKNMQTDILF